MTVSDSIIVRYSLGFGRGGSEMDDLQHCQNMCHALVSVTVHTCSRAPANVLAAPLTQKLSEGTQTS